MIAPPTNSHLSRYARDCDMWVEYQHMQSLLDPQEITEDCEGMYEDAYGSAAKQDRDGLVLSDLEQDLVNMSNQPAIRNAYRRFVIIKSDADVRGRPGEQDWVSDRNEFHVRVIDLLVVSSVSGSWFRGSGLATKSIPRTTHDIYGRYIMCTMVTGEVVSLKSQISRRVVTWTGYSGNFDPERSHRSFRTTGSHSLEQCFHCPSLSLARLFAGRTTIDTPLNHGPPTTNPTPESVTLRLSPHSITHRQQGRLR